MKKRQRGSAACQQFRGIGGARRPVDVCSARTGVERRLHPNKQKMRRVYTGALLANLWNSMIVSMNNVRKDFNYG